MRGISLLRLASSFAHSSAEQLCPRPATGALIAFVMLGAAATMVEAFTPPTPNTPYLTGSTRQAPMQGCSGARENSAENARSITLRHAIRCAVPPGGPPSLVPILPEEPDKPEPPTQPTTQPNPPPVAPQPGDQYEDKGFRYFPPGKLPAQDAGRGREDRRVWLPDIIFPLKLSADQHPHLNSQIWGYGGGGWGGRGAAGGSECDPRNYDPRLQRDNYCEVRGHSMPLCPAGRGHQGQDIRPPTCRDNKWEVVAVVDGIINMVTRNTTVGLKAKDGTQYRYLHMHPRSIKVRVGERVKQGQVLGRMSRYMGGKTQTTTHLHFDVRQRVKVGNQPARNLYVPIYTSLIAAYRKAKGLPIGIDENGNLKPDPLYEVGVKPPPETEARRKAEEDARRKAEEDARRKAEEDARRKADEDARRRAEEDARRKAEEDARRKAEEDARRKAEEDARRKAEEDARRKAEEDARRKAEEDARRKAEVDARRKAEEDARR